MAFTRLEKSEIGKDFPSALKLMLKNVFALDEQNNLWIQQTNGRGKGGLNKFIIRAYEGLDYRYSDYELMKKYCVLIRAYDSESALEMANFDPKTVAKINKVFELKG